MLSAHIYLLGNFIAFFLCINFIVADGLISLFLYRISLSIMQQKGTFETGQEDSKEIPEDLKLRLAYREAAVAILACYFPDPYRPFTQVIVLPILFSVSFSFWAYTHYTFLSLCVLCRLI